MGQKITYFCDNCKKEKDSSDLSNAWNHALLGVAISFRMPVNGDQRWCYNCRKKKAKEVIQMLHRDVK